MNLDVIVIGGGPAGYVAAIRAAQLGGRVTLVEEARVGGTCLNVGCIPTKSLLHSAEVLGRVARAAEYGIDFDGLRVDYAKIFARKDATVRQLVSGVEYLLKKNGVVVVRGRGTLLGPGIVRVSLTAGGEQTLEGRAVILATGSGQVSLPGIALDGRQIIGSTEALSLNPPPQSMLIIGGGAVGVEFASIYSRFGTKVTLVELLPRILPGEEPEVSAELTDALRLEGIVVKASARVSALHSDDHAVTVQIIGPEGPESIRVEKVLVAVGRKPRLEGLWAESVPVVVAGGFIRVNDRMETGVPGLYAAGDITGGAMLAHKAEEEGVTAAENAMGLDRRFHGALVPRCVYTHPEVASVGLSEEEAVRIHTDVRAGTFPFRANGRALTEAEPKGFVKVVTAGKHGRVVGVSMVGVRATELIAAAGFAIALEATVAEFDAICLAHPTLSEALKEAVLNTVGRSLHAP